MNGQVAVVTGASGGLGRVIAQRLAGAGMQVAVLARSEDQLAETVSLIEADGGRALAVAADVTDSERVERAFREVEAELAAPIDLLVNSAGTAGPVAPLWEADPSEWWHALEVNLFGTFLCCRAVLPGMVARRAGRIVNLTSNAGIYRWPYLSAYAISKAGVIKLTENLGVETKRHRIKVFAINPGMLRVGMTEALLSAEIPDDHPARIVADWFRQELESGREVSLDEAAAFVVLVGSGRADALSGRYLSVYDDLDALVGRASSIQRADLYTLRLRESPISGR